MSDAAAELAAEELPDESEDELDEPGALAQEAEPLPIPDVVLDAGYQALTLSDASAIAAEIGATTVLVAGPHDAGKTTLLVQLYAQFLHGPFSGFSFAGSATLDAFDRRHYLARVSSGRKTADTERTDDEDLRFLHLRLGDATGHQALLMTDIKGEVFEDFLLGTGAAEGLHSLARRADKVAVVIDGARIAQLSMRQGALMQARQLVGALTQEGWVRAASPMQIVLLKQDLLSAEQVAWFEAESLKLREFALKQGLATVGTSAIAARPKSHQMPSGLGEFLKWVTGPVQRPPVLPARPATAGRTFATGVVVA